MNKLVNYLRVSQIGLLATILFFSLIISGCKKNPDDLPDDIMQDAIFFDGNINGVSINCEENGDFFQMFAAEGHVIVYFNDGVNLNTAKSTIESFGGQIIEQIPSIEYYLIKVEAGKENDFISKIENQNSVEYVVLNLIYSERATCNSNVVILDNFNAGNSPTHGSNVGSVYESCRGNSYCISTKELGFLENGKVRIKGKDAINEMSRDYMFNMSFGPILENASGNTIKWNEANNTEKLSYLQAQMQQIKDVIIRLKKLKKTGPLSNTVVTIAAGNEALPDFYQSVIVPMLNSGSSSDAQTKYWLNSEEQKILKENILIVTANDPSYSNQSSPHYAIAQVDISDLTLTGTSYAAPRALCYISQIMEQKSLNATQALAEAKKMIANNNGLFVSPTLPTSIKPTVSISNIKSTTAIATVIINPTEILKLYPNAVQVGITMSTSPTFSTYQYGNDNFSSTKSTYQFNCPELLPATTYYIYGWVKYGNNYLEGRPENTTSFKTLPKDSTSNNGLAGTRWSCYAYGFNVADACYLQGASGYMQFTTTRAEFYNGNGSGGYNLELSGTYILFGTKLDINFGDVIFDGNVIGTQLQGAGKHYVTGGTHNFRWNGTKQTTKSNIVLSKEKIVRDCEHSCCNH